MLEKLIAMLSFLRTKQKVRQLAGVHERNSLTIVFLILFILLDSNTLLAEEKKTLTVVTFRGPKQVIYLDELTKDLKGPLADFYRAIGADLNVDIKIVGPVPIRRMMLGMTNGTYDMSALVSKTPEREKVMHYSAQPIMYRTHHIVAAKRLQLGTQFPIKKLQDMGPLLKSVGTEKLICPLGINLPEFIKLNADKLNIWNLALIPGKWEAQANELIKAGRAGAVVMLNVDAGVLMTKNAAHLELIELPITRANYVVFSKKTIEQSFVNEFNSKFSDLALRYKQHQETWMEKNVEDE